jgi:hypothetical protein
MQGPRQIMSNGPKSLGKSSIFVCLFGWFLILGTCEAIEWFQDAT